MTGPILRLKDVITHTGLSRSAIYDRMDKKSPRYAADFPKSFPLGGNAIGWFKAEIDAWLEICSKSPRDTTPSKKSKQGPKTKGLEVQKSAKPLRTASQQGALNKHSTTTQRKPDSISRKGNLAEMIVEGGRINTRLIAYLNMTSWTPAMAAMLASGIEPMVDCIEIPYGGIGLDETPLHGSNARLHDARRILKEWHEWMEEQDNQKLEVEPIQFLKWCMEENIDTEWLRIFMEFAGIEDEKRIDLTSSRFAKLINN